jgi:hypothetical protein
MVMGWAIAIDGGVNDDHGRPRRAQWRSPTDAL